jgi:hypothetical protein
VSRAIVSAPVVGLIVAGCSSTSKKAGTASGSPTTSALLSGSAPTGSQIVIGTIGSYTGPLASPPNTDLPIMQGNAPICAPPALISSIAKAVLSKAG